MKAVVTVGMKALLLGATVSGILACEGTIEDLPDPMTGEPPAGYCDDNAEPPGFGTLRRMNAVEYDNTVRDLLGETESMTNGFPVDDPSSDGFLNDADTLTIGPVRVELYAAAAADLAERAVIRDSFQERFMTCDGNQAACVSQFLATFGIQAWRRPLTSDETSRLQAIGAAQEGFADAAQSIVHAMLLSPNFLFRTERHAGFRELDGYELASRLSYFLWSSTPDATLLSLAEGNQLQDTTVLRNEVSRMLADERADAFMNEFALRWLHVLDGKRPSEEIFPEFTNSLRDAMLEETRLFFRDLIENNRPVTDLLTANFTYLNEELAEHYGIEGVTGSEMQRVELPSSTHRGGVLTQGSVLLTTSHPNRSSPILRGVYVLEHLICAPPPEPPANVDALPEGEEEEGEGPLTLRERTERHRADPACATCHDTIDPIGFALEHFDATGAYRTMDGEDPIDANGTLPDGQSFNGAIELSATLAGDERFQSCVSQKLMAYGLGRALTYDDFCALERIESQARGEGEELHLRDLMVELVLDEYFRTVGEDS